MNQRKPDPSKPGIPRLDSGKRKCRGNRRINRIPACIENGNTRPRRIPRLRNNNPSPPPSGRLGDLPVLRTARHGLPFKPERKPCTFYNRAQYLGKKKLYDNPAET
jgi:hypothetical protein